MPKPSADAIKAQYQQALAAQKQRNFSLAMKLYKELLTHLPGKPEILFQMGVIYFNAKAHEAAKECLLGAAKAKPDEPEILNLLWQVHNEIGEQAEALDILDRLIKMNPKAPRPRAEKAIILQQQGDFEGAEAELKKAIARNPLNGELYRIVTTGRKIKRGDPMIRSMLKAVKETKGNDRNQMQLGYGLAKAFEDTGEYDKVFKFLKMANDINSQLFPYDRETRRKELDAIKGLYDSIDIPPQQDDPEFTPIFVTGMPRSGTTLVERILASHSKVSAAGEFAYVGMATFAAMGIKTTLDEIAPPSQGDYDIVKAEYQKRLKHDIGLNTPYVTDKSIQSYMVAGVLASAIPSARFVVLRRDPADVALSIYKNFFMQGTHRYASSLEDIAWYYRTFQEMVDYWKAKMPGRIYEISYEDLTGDQEAETRKLLEYVGLEWEDQVLEFHRSKGQQVKTLSMQQVRQPISQKSVGGWRRYENEMQPFIDAMERYS